MQPKTVQDSVRTSGGSAFGANQHRVRPARLVPALDEFEESEPSRRVRGEANTVQELALQGLEEALAHRFGVTVVDRAHGGSYTGRAAALAEGFGLERS